MKIMKGVFTYILILLGMVLAAGILLFTSMAFLKFEVFGLNVIMHNDTYDWSSAIGYAEYNGETNNWAKKHRELYINSNGYDVVVRPWTEKVHEWKDFAAVYVTDNGFGLSTNGVSNAQLKVSYKMNSIEDEDFVTGPTFHDNWWFFDTWTDARMTDANVVIMDLITPQGLISYKDSKIEVILPWCDEFSYDLHINSGNGDINIIPATEPDTNTVELGNLPIKSLYLTTNKGDVTVEGLAKEGSSRELSTMELKTNTGKFDLSGQDFNVKGTVKINSTRGDFKFKNITSAFVIYGDNLVLDAEGIYTSGKQFSYNCPNGTIDIDTLDVGTGTAFIVTEYAKVDIDHIKGDTTIQATYGDTHIGTTWANGICVYTTNGDITVDKVLTRQLDKDGNETGISRDGVILLRSTYGDITINEYRGNAWVSNERGKINVTQSTTSYEKTTYTKLETERGEVIANNISGQIEAVATGNANMTIKYYRLRNAECVSDITIGAGTLRLEVPTQSQQTAGFAVKIVSIKDGGSVEMKSNDSLDETYTTIDGLTDGYAKGSGSNAVEFHLTVNGGKVVFNEFSKQYN